MQDDSSHMTSSTDSRKSAGQGHFGFPKTDPLEDRRKRKVGIVHEEKSVAAQGT